MRYVLGFLAAFAVSALVTPVIARLARRWGAVDIPLAEPRKRHPRPTPLLGGTAIFFSVTAVTLFVLSFTDLLPAPFLSLRQIAALTIGGAILIVGGALDDRHRLSPSRQFVFPALAAAIAVLGGVSIDYVRNPFGGQIDLNLLTVPVFGWMMSLPADPLTFLWLLGMMYTTKFLDGLDGLVVSVSVVAATVMIALALRPDLYQPETALFSAILDGALVGFLIWNFPPARVFLGEGGSTYAGFMIGSLAVAAGSKVATTLLVLGIPIMDVAWVVVRRLFWERRSPAAADRKHLHFRLLDAGLSAREAVLLLTAISAVFGLAGLFLDTAHKALALIVLALVMIGLAAFVIRKYRSTLV